MSSATEIFNAIANIENFDFSDLNKMVSGSAMGDVFDGFTQLSNALSSVIYEFQTGDFVFNVDRVVEDLEQTRLAMIKIADAFSIAIGEKSPLADLLSQTLDNFKFENLVGEIIRLAVDEDPPTPENLKLFLDEILSVLGYNETVSGILSENIANSYGAMTTFLNELSYFRSESPTVEILFYLPNMFTELLPSSNNCTIESISDAVFEILYIFQGDTSDVFGVFLETAKNGVIQHLTNRGINMQNIVDRYESIIFEVMQFASGDNSTNPKCEKRVRTLKITQKPTMPRP